MIESATRVDSDSGVGSLGATYPALPASAELNIAAWLAQAGVPSLTELVAAPPSPEVMAALEGLDSHELDDADRVRYLQALDRQIAWLQSLQQDAIVVVADQPDDPAFDWGREEVAAALRLSCYTARRRIEIARALGSRLRGTADALGRAEITYWHVLTLVEALDTRSDEVAATVEAMVLPLGCAPTRRRPATTNSPTAPNRRPTTTRAPWTPAGPTNL